jgi:hypothetical protein
LSLLTVEQLVPLAAQMERERQRRRLETRAQLMEDWSAEVRASEASDQDESQDDDGSPALPQARLTCSVGGRRVPFVLRAALKKSLWRRQSKQSQRIGPKSIAMHPDRRGSVKTLRLLRRPCP